MNNRVQFWIWATCVEASDGIIEGEVYKIETSRHNSQTLTLVYSARNQKIGWFNFSQFLPTDNMDATAPPDIKRLTASPPSPRLASDRSDPAQSPM